MFQREPGMRTLRTARAGAINLAQRRIWHAEGEDDPTPDTGTGQAKTGQGQGNESTFTQADLDRLVGSARKQARDSAVADLLKELGVENADTLKASLKAQREAEDAKKSELEKRDARIAALEKEAADAKAAVEKAQQERMEERRQAAILTGLKDAKKPADLLILVNARMADAVAATMAEDGTLDDKKIAALVEKIKQEWPDQFQSVSPGSQSNSGGRVKQPEANKELVDRIKRSIRY